MGPIDTQLEIETPERVRFRHRVAGPGTRALALAVDLAIQGTVLGLLALLGVLAGGLVPGASQVVSGLGLVVLFLVSWFYAAAFEVFWAGRTPGKALLGLRVVRSDGARIGLRDALLRNLLRGADALPVGYVVGGLVSMADPAFRRLGDLVAGTVVVVEERTRPPEALRVDPPVTEAERQALPVHVALRRDELRVIEELLRRLPRLWPERAEELAERLAPLLAAREGVEAPTALRTVQLAWARATGNDR